MQIREIVGIEQLSWMFCNSENAVSDYLDSQSGQI